MRVIKNNIAPKSPMKITFPLSHTCENCGSELEIEENDVKIGFAGMAYIDCPVCNKQSFLYMDELDETVTKDTLEFPKHFYHFGESEDVVRITPEEIKQRINEAIKFFRENPNNFCWHTSSGDTSITVFNFAGDQQYLITVAKDYYELDLDFEAEDKILVREEDWDNRGVFHRG